MGSSLNDLNLVHDQSYLTLPIQLSFLCPRLDYVDCEVAADPTPLDEPAPANIVVIVAEVKVRFIEELEGLRSIRMEK